MIWLFPLTSRKARLLELLGESVNMSHLGYFLPCLEGRNHISSHWYEEKCNWLLCIFQKIRIFMHCNPCSCISPSSLRSFISLCLSYMCLLRIFEHCWNNINQLNIGKVILRLLCFQRNIIYCTRHIICMYQLELLQIMSWWSPKKQCKCNIKLKMCIKEYFPLFKFELGSLFV